MRTRTKLVMTALTAALVLSAAVGTASARRLALNNQTFRAVWGGTPNGLLFSNAGGGLSVRCPVTIEGSFHSATLSKVSGQLIGYVTKANVAPFTNCTERENVTGVIILNEGQGANNSLPWHIRYDSFNGTLPNITGIRLQLVGAKFLLTAFGVSCLYTSTAARPAFGIVNREAGGTVTGLTADTSREIPISPNQNFLCPSSGIFEGTASVTQLGNTNSVSVTLVQ